MWLWWIDGRFDIRLVSPYTVLYGKCIKAVELRSRSSSYVTRCAIESESSTLGARSFLGIMRLYHLASYAGGNKGLRELDLPPVIAIIMKDFSSWQYDQQDPPLRRKITSSVTTEKMHSIISILDRGLIECLIPDFISSSDLHKSFDSLHPFLSLLFTFLLLHMLSA